MTAQVAVAKQRLRGAAIPLPPPLRTPRARAQAWGLALAVHGVLMALALWGLKSPPAEAAPPLVRLVFIEPPPPPPPPVGAPAGAGSVAEPPVSIVPAEETRPKAEPKRVAAPKRPAPAARRKPEPRPQPPPAQALALEAVRPGSSAGTAGGTTQGVAGGVEDGTPGGVVGGRGSGPVPAGQVAHPPALLARVSPQYPHAARQRGIMGLVLLEAILDTHGRIDRDIKVLQSVPDLDEAALAALRQWRFEPARDEHGRKVPVILEVPFRFVLR
jgi:protein TonB